MEGRGVGREGGREEGRQGGKKGGRGEERGKEKERRQTGCRKRGMGRNTPQEYTVVMVTQSPGSSRS